MAPSSALAREPQTTTSKQVPDLLSFALRHAQQLKEAGFSYGEGPKTANCVTFIEPMIENALGRPLTEAERQQVKIDFWKSLNSNDRLEQYRRAVLRDDPMSWGAAKVLVDAGLAHYVENRNDLKPGDLIQYSWNEGKKGHVGVVAADKDGNVFVTRNGEKGILLVGAHSTADGIGTTFVPLKEIQNFKAARMSGDAAKNVNKPLERPNSGVLVGAGTENTTEVEAKLGRIRRGENDAYIREGSSGPEVRYLKDQLLKWGLESGKLSPSERATLARTLNSDKMTAEWAEVMAKFQLSVGLNDDGTLNKNPQSGQQLAADRVWGIRSQRALDLFFGRENTAEFQAVSWEEFKKITNGVWTQAQMDAAGWGGSDEAELGPIDGSGLQTSSAPKAKVNFVEIDPDTLIRRGICKNFQEAQNVIAFLGAISEYEGTGKEDGYRIMYGGGTFNDFSKHPDRVISAGRYCSAAAGKYQFMPGTYADIRMQNMQPLTQDLGAIALLARRRVLDDVKRGDWAGAMRGGAAAEWASLPKGLGDSAGAYRQINDSGRYGKVLASIDRYRRGVNELYSKPASEPQVQA